LAHIYLDLANFPTYIRLQPTILIQKITAEPDAFLGGKNDAIDRLVSGILDYLQDAIYATPLTNKYKLERTEGLLTTFARNKKKNELESGGLLKLIMKGKARGFPTHKEPKEKRSHRLRLRMTYEGRTDSANVRPIATSEKFNETVNNHTWSCFVTTYYGPLGLRRFFDLFELEREGNRAYGRVVQAIIEFLNDFYRNQAKPAEFIRWQRNERMGDLTRFVLSRAIGDQYRLRLNKEQSFSDYAVELLEDKSVRDDWWKTLKCQPRFKGLLKDRRKEVECLHAEVSNAHDGIVMVVTCPVVLEDEKNETKAEFDGAYIELKGEFLDVTLIEAKNLARGASSAAEKDLKDKLDKLKMNEMSSQVKKRDDYAAVTIRL
jgi:hypothetical protein